MFRLRCLGRGQLAGLLPALENGFGSLGRASAGHFVMDRRRVLLCVRHPPCGSLDLVVLQAGDRRLGIGAIHRSWGLANGRTVPLLRKKAKDV